MTLTTSFARAAALVGSLLPLAALAQYSTPMRNVDNPDRMPYLETTNVTISPPFVNAFAFFPTPAGKRVVIEWVSMGCSSSSASDVFAQVYLNVLRPGGNSGQSIALAPMVRTGSGVFIGNVSLGQTVLKAYAEPVPSAPDGGNGIYLNIFHTESSQNASCNATVSGHLVTP